MLIEGKHKCLKIICSASLFLPLVVKELSICQDTVFIMLFNKKVNKPAALSLNYTNCKPPQVLVSN